MLGNFNEEAQFILLKSREEMLELHHPYIGTEHLVLSILKNENTISKRLKDYGLTYDTFKNEILTIIGKGTKKSPFFLYTPLLRKIMDNALLDAKDNNNGEVTVEHLFSSLLEEGEGIAIRIFIGMDINLEDLYDEFSSKLIKKTKKRRRKLLIEELGINLVEKAQNQKLDPVIGREKEINRLIEILCRRTKNNPILIGEAGVGKTAIIEELANRIASGEVPANLEDKKIISLDMSTVVSGTKYRGEFEERMQKILKEVTNEGNIILFIDEIHTLVGAGGAEGAIDASNILKPFLARGTIKCIGATTIQEYKKYIEQDKALDRRFQQITIEEPNQEATTNILKKLKPIYEHYHHVTIPDHLIEKLVELSNKYIYNRHNPDKSIDILDEVSSMVSVGQTKNQKKITKLKKELATITKNKTAFILDNDMENAYTYLKKESTLTSKLNELTSKNNQSQKIITIEDIAKVINQKTGIPVYEIMKDNIKTITKLETALTSSIIGQNKAIQELINTTKKLKLGYSNHKIKSYLFVGPTGVGKTNLAKTYAKELMGNNNLIRLDMSEYSDATAINKIIGSSPGYIGYQDNNNILDKLKDKPTSILLLDEIDKAHPSVINLLYQILDEGQITDAKNNTINLNNNIIIMTSNLGFESTKLGFNQDKNSPIKSELKQKFPSSLINRIDNIIVFNHLTEKDITTIIKNKLKKLETKYPNLTYSNQLIKEIITESEYQEYGARRIDKIIDSTLENTIIDKILNNDPLTLTHLKEYQSTT
ncbi:MAG: ATP-dependent Clp protease ATP-binding subunit [Bacilli bacterium]|nr:ATP-dependent Clp protease ATP-binding subunit [Bacilli bacterium]